MDLFGKKRKRELMIQTERHSQLLNQTRQITLQNNNIMELIKALAEQFGLLITIHAPTNGLAHVAMANSREPNTVHIRPVTHKPKGKGKKKK